MLARACPLGLRAARVGRPTKARANFSGNATRSNGEAAPDTFLSATVDRGRSMFDAYSALLQEFPLRTNAVVSGLLCAFGDALAQLCESKLNVQSPNKSGYNVMRTVRMSLFGTCCGPAYCLWYRTLATVGEAMQVSYAPVVGTRLARLLEASPFRWANTLHRQEEQQGVSPLKILVAKVLADSLLFQAPLLNLYFASMGVLEGLSLEQIYRKTTDSFTRAWGLGLLVWTPVQLVNLHLVPIMLQPSVVAAVNVGWKTTLSVLDHYHDYGSPLQRNHSFEPHGEAQRQRLLMLEAQVERLLAENEVLRMELAASEAAGRTASLATSPIELLRTELEAHRRPGG